VKAWHIFWSIGTYWQIDIEARLMLYLCLKSMPALNTDKTYSRFRDDSLITAIAKESVLTRYHPFGGFLVTYRQIYTHTEQHLWPVIIWCGYDTYSLNQRAPITAVTMGWCNDIQRYYLNDGKSALLIWGSRKRAPLIDIVGEFIEEHGYHS
jgi:hypothetical protein